VAAGHDLDRLAAGGDELHEELPQLRTGEPVPAGVRNHGAAAARADPRHRVGEPGPLVRHIGRLAGDEIAVEYRFHVAGHAAFDQEAREMRAPHEVRIGGIGVGPFQGARHAQRVELRRDPLRAPRATRAHVRQAAGKRVAAGIHAQPDDVDRDAAPGDRDFHPRHEPDAALVCGRLRFREAGQVVVIGERQDTDAVRGGAAHQRGGREHAVRRGGMTVQIEVLRDGGEHAAILAAVPPRAPARAQPRRKSSTIRASASG
jgi:hypothetical protein